MLKKKWIEKFKPGIIIECKISGDKNIKILSYPKYNIKANEWVIGAEFSGKKSFICLTINNLRREDLKIVYDSKEEII